MFKIIGTFQVGPTIMEEDMEEVTLRRDAFTEDQRDEIVEAMNRLGVLTLSVDMRDTSRRDF
jgi:hypothetical protein